MAALPLHSRQVKGLSLFLAISDDPYPAVAGQPPTFTLTPVNAGHATENIVLSAPAGLLNPEFSDSDGAFRAPWTGVFIMDSLSAGAFRQVYIRGVVDKGVAGPQGCTVSISSDETDPDPANNTASEATEARFAPPAG